MYKINGTTGSIIWQLSGNSTDFKLGKDVEFAFQHHARFVSKSADGKKEIISLFDNSAHGTENGKGKEIHFYKYSRGKIIEVNTETWEATTIQVPSIPHISPPDYRALMQDFRRLIHQITSSPNLKAQPNSSPTAMFS